MEGRRLRYHQARRTSPQLEDALQSYFKGGDKQRSARPTQSTLARAPCRLRPAKPERGNRNSRVVCPSR